MAVLWTLVLWLVSQAVHGLWLAFNMNFVCDVRCCLLSVLFIPAQSCLGVHLGPAGAAACEHVCWMLRLLQGT
jgi:hypothetical protein